MGVMTGPSDIAAGVNFISLPSWSRAASAAGSSFDSFRRYRFSCHAHGRFRHSPPSDARLSISSSHKMEDRFSSESRRMPEESSGDVSTNRGMKFQTVHRVLAVVLSTLLSGTPALAGVETTLEPKLSGLVDTSTDKVSSVEAILAKQLARRFREMSDEELILVLQELLKASRSSVSSSQDAVLDPKPQNLGENRIPANAGNDAQYPLPQAKPGGEVRNEVEPKEGGTKNGGLETSTLPGPSTTQASGITDYTLTEKAPPPGKEPLPVPQEIITREDPSSSAGAREEREEAATKEPPGRSDNGGESETEDMTGMLWDEWRRRVKDQGPLEPAISEEGSNTATGRAIDFWEKVQSFSRTTKNGASEFSAWIGDNQEAVGGGLLASGIIFSVLFVREKFLSLKVGNRNETDTSTKDARSPTKSQPSPSDKDSSEKNQGSFLQSIRRSFGDERNRLLGSEKASSQAENSQLPAWENIIGISNDKDSGPDRPSRDSMLQRSKEARDNRTDIATQDSDTPRTNFLSPSEQEQDSPPGSLRGQGGGKQKSIRLKTSSNGVDDSYPRQWRKNGNEENGVYKSSQFPQVTGGVSERSTNSEAPELEEMTSSRAVDEPPTREKKGPLRSLDSKEQRNWKVHGSTVGKRTGLDSGEKVPFAGFQRMEEPRKVDDLQSGFSQGGLSHQTRGNHVQNSYESESAVKPNRLEKEVDKLELQDRLESKTASPEEVGEVVVNASQESTSSQPGGSDGNEAVERTATTRMTPFGESMSVNSGAKDYAVLKKSLSPSSGASLRLGNNRLATEPSKRSRIQDPVLLRNHDQNEAEDSKQGAEVQEIRAPEAVNDMDTQIRASGSSGLEDEGLGLRFVMEQDVNGRSASGNTLAGGPGRTYSKSMRRSADMREEEVATGKATEGPIFDSGGIPVRKVRSDMSSAARKKRLLGSEVGNQVSGRVSTSLGENRRVDASSNRGATASEEGFRKGEADWKSGKRYSSEGRHNTGRNSSESRGDGHSRPQLDSFVHNQDFWVRDSDGVFIKQPIESQGKILRGKQINRMPDKGGDYENRKVDGESVKLTEVRNGAAKPGQRKERSNHGFDYRELYLTPKEKDSNSSESFDSKSAEINGYSGILNPSDNGGTKPIRYGTERTP
ncbi:hypothetical protein R1sor_010881 [Riccia sorocarpa]|uniref:Uncharacterized protein n=1 Tax=Riccia sorocarpa TaxID=122646 RepID=A0ABD3I2Y1_9MARC